MGGEPGAFLEKSKVKEKCAMHPKTKQKYQK